VQLLFTNRNIGTTIYAEFSLSNDVDFSLGDFFRDSDVSDNLNVTRTVLTRSKVFFTRKYNRCALEVESSKDFRVAQ
jgi:hypothetical protein